MEQGINFNICGFALSQPPEMDNTDNVLGTQNLKGFLMSQMETMYLSLGCVSHPI